MLIFVCCVPCGTSGRVPEKLAGRQVSCRKCGARLPIPAVKRRLPRLPFIDGDGRELLRLIRWHRLSRVAQKVNRRSSLRRSCRGLNVRLFLGDRVSSANPYDISNGGLGLVVQEPLEPGTVLAVELKDRRGTVCVKRLRVTHATALANGGWLVGGMFLNPKAIAN